MKSAQKYKSAFDVINRFRFKKINIIHIKCYLYKQNYECRQSYSIKTPLWWRTNYINMYNSKEE